MDRKAQEKEFPQAKNHAQLPDDGHAAKQPKPAALPKGYQQVLCPNCGAQLVVDDKGEAFHTSSAPGSV